MYNKDLDGALIPIPFLMADFHSMARKTKDEALATRLKIVDAARQVFCARGVSRTSLEQIAAAAGLTRGAIYWHFKDKTELFFAVKDEYIKPFSALTDILCAGDPDPLVRLESYLKSFFAMLVSDRAAAETFEMMVLRCEYTDAFRDVVETIYKPAKELEQHFAQIYTQAHAHSLIAPDLSPKLLAEESLVFFLGLFNQSMHHTNNLRAFGKQARDIIETHVRLRRCVPVSQLPARKRSLSPPGKRTRTIAARPVFNPLPRS